MKKFFYSLAPIITIAVLATILPLFAYAADIDSQTTDVEFILTESDLQLITPTPGDSTGGTSTPATEDESSGWYTIYIPYNISLNQTEDISINWMFWELPDTKQIVVSIDGARTFPDGEFYLYCGDGSTPAQRIVCDILRGSAADTSEPPSEMLRGPDDAVVAVFRGGSWAPENYGRVVFEPHYNLDNVAGTYTGTVHFKIAIVNE